MKYTATVVKVLVLCLSAINFSGCASTKADDDPFGLFKLAPEKDTGLPQKNDGPRPSWFVEKVLMFYRDEKDGEWMTKTIKVVAQPDLKPATCFKAVAHDKAECFYITQKGDVSFQTVRIEGYDET